MSIPVSEYLFKRLHELGVRGIHGLPGDFNLASLDLIPQCGLYWVGNANELNASYAADGYARIKGISALMTTFGVGELSALNGIAGAYSEHVPIVHIVGMPNSAAQKAGLLLHHTLGNGDFTVYERMSRAISETTVILNDPHTAAQEIDRVLRICYIRARPVYIGVPTDIAFEKIPAVPLKKPLDLSLHPNDAKTEAEVVAEIKEHLYKAKNPIILADACTIRHRVVNEVRELMDKTNLPTFVSPMGKSAVDETHKAFGGVYAGDVSREDVKKRVEGADLVLYVGGLKSDFNSGGFTYRITRDKTIEFHSDHMKIRYATFPGVQMNQVLRKLIDTLDVSKLSIHGGTELVNKLPKHERDSVKPEITHDYLWPTVGKWMKEKDVIVTETGTSNFGILEAQFPAGVTHISQVLYGSIGYSVGAVQGAALAVKENNTPRRVILWVGDGSLQLTVQEIATMIRHGLKPIIFVINNSGYTIERMIHGPKEKYNDITPWKHTKLLEVLGGKEGEWRSWQVKTRLELEKLFADEEFSAAKVIQLVEVFMPQDDAPRALVEVGKITAQRNATGQVPEQS